MVDKRKRNKIQVLIDEILKIDAESAAHLLEETFPEFVRKAIKMRVDLANTKYQKTKKQ